MRWSDKDMQSGIRILTLTKESTNLCTYEECIVKGNVTSQVLVPRESGLREVVAAVGAAQEHCSDPNVRQNCNTAS